HPDLERAKAARQLKAIVPEGEGFALFYLVNLYLVGFRRCDCCPRPGRIPKEKTAAINRRVEPLVRVQRKRICPLHPAKECAPFTVECGERTVCSVHMEP